jgi:probable HAF family extracellular repeat protein
MLYALDLRSRLTRLSLAAAILVCPAKAGPAILDLGTLGGPTSTANAISPDGSAVAGTSDTASGIPHPFLWRQNS